MPVQMLPTTEEMTLRGRVVRLFYQSSAFTAGVLKPAGECQVRFNGKFIVAEGDDISLVGHWTTHPQYGRQFAASGLKQELPIDAAGLARYLASEPAFFQIGEVKARKIAEAFADNFDFVIRKEPWRVAQTARLSAETLNTLRTEWLKRAEVNALSSWLGSFGLTHRQITRMVEHLGHNAKALLTDNPYELCRILPGFGFSRVDDIAQKLGVEKEHPERIAAAFRHLLLKAEHDGHCWQEEVSVEQDAFKLLCLDSLQARRLISELLEREVAAGRLFRYDGGGRLVIALPALAKRELDILRAVVTHGTQESELPARWLELLDEEAAELNLSQRQATLMVIQHALSLIAGAAGSGKSYTIAAIYRAFVQLYGEDAIALAAPTGKAAKRLETLCGVEAKTIHRLLEYNTVTWGRSHDNPLSEQVVIVDELSMTDVHLMWHLLDAIDFDTTRLILVGDPNQLPPVGPGNVLRDLLTRRMLSTTVLDQVVRQAGTLKENCSAILRGDVRDTAEGENGILRPWYLIDDCRGEQAVLDSLEEIITDVVPRLGLDPVRDIQVLTPTNKGPLGTRALNILLQRLVQQQRFDVQVPAVPEQRRPEFFIGDKVMQVRNNYTLELMNGAIGVVDSIVQKTDEKSKHPVEMLVLDFDGRKLQIPRHSDDADDLMLAYASTVHKSQGSEFPVIIAVVHRAQSFMLNRNLLYTAVTRAQRSAILLGDAVGIRRAIDRRDVDARRTFLALADPMDALKVSF